MGVSKYIYGSGDTFRDIKFGDFSFIYF